MTFNSGSGNAHQIKPLSLATGSMNSSIEIVNNQRRDATNSIDNILIRTDDDDDLSDDQEMMMIEDGFAEFKDETRTIYDLSPYEEREPVGGKGASGADGKE